MSDEVKNGSTVKVHYEGTLSDGTVFDSSRERGNALEFKIGDGNLLPDFENGITGMTVGEKKSIEISNAYGERVDTAIIKVSKEMFPEDFPLEVGQVVEGTNPNGQTIHATITSYDDAEVELDHNHPLAGKDLNFEVELMEIVDL